MTHLELDRPQDVVPAAPSPAAVAPEEDPALNRRLYEEIGAEHDWVDHRGRGIGGDLLARALTHALGPMGGARVVVETCDLDGPAALPNYRRRGLRVVRTERELRRRHPHGGDGAAG